MWASASCSRSPIAGREAQGREARVDDQAVDIALGESLDVFDGQGEGQGGEAHLGGCAHELEFGVDAQAVFFERFPDLAVDEAHGGPVGDALDPQAAQALQPRLDVHGRVGGHDPGDDGHGARVGEDMSRQEFLGLLVGVAIGEQRGEGAFSQSAIGARVERQQRVRAGRDGVLGDLPRADRNGQNRRALFLRRVGERLHDRMHGSSLYRGFVSYPDLGARGMQGNTGLRPPVGGFAPVSLCGPRSSQLARFLRRRAERGLATCWAAWKMDEGRCGLDRCHWNSSAGRTHDS